ncbi:MAG: HAD family phosphatase [Armatimonadetes bacterium]|nr:HAD family phosphatase [Armatimonadota bacterium]
MIRLIACDMDGTLMTSSRVPHPANIPAIQKVVDAGIHFCLASGRGIQTIYPTAKEIGLTGPIISSNGGYVVGLQGEEVHHFHLPMGAKQIIVEFALEHDLHLNGYFKSEIAFSSGGLFAEMYVSRTGCEAQICHPREMMGREATKLLYVGEPDQLVQLRPKISELLAVYGISVVVSEPEYLEFLPPGINKGAGLQKLSEHLGIDRADVAAIGDWLNDKEMLEWAGISAAVENGHADVKAIADHVIPSNDNGGVANFLEFVLKGT